MVWKQKTESCKVFIHANVEEPEIFNSWTTSSFLSLKIPNPKGKTQEFFDIESGIEIACHPEATHYSYKSGKINFFKVNPNSDKKMKEIPKGINTVQIAGYREHWRMGARYAGGWINYGTAEFRSHGGNILKAEEYR